MGVKDLWKLLEPAGRPVNLESLAGVVLAVDVSIWLNQAVKGMRDRHGNPVPHAHLVVLFNRICKLLHYQIKPVFVFDGATPPLKKQTLVERSRRRQRATQRSLRATDKQVTKFLQAKILEQLYGEGDTSTPQLTIPPGPPPAAVDMFELPPLPDNALDKDKSPDSPTPHPSTLAAHAQEVVSLDIHSDEFSSLPPEVQHELLLERQELEKHSHHDPATLPQVASDFSSYQLSKLLNQSRTTHKLEEVRRVLKSNETAVMGLEANIHTVETNPILSSEDAHYILVRGADIDSQSSQDEPTEDEWDGGIKEEENNWVAESEQAKSDDVIDARIDQNPVKTSGTLEDHTDLDKTITPDTVVQDPGCLSVATGDTDLSVVTEPAKCAGDKVPVDSERPVREDGIVSATESGQPRAAVTNDISLTIAISREMSDGDNPVVEHVDLELHGKPSHTEMRRSPLPLQLDPPPPLVSITDNNIPQSVKLDFTTPQSSPTQSTSSEKSSLDWGEGEDALLSLPPSEAQGLLRAEVQELERERAQQSRAAAAVSNQMYKESQELLALFGLPYIVAPSEAEAQCAHLDLTRQAEGTITDDNDVLLFGGRCVYRGLFSQDKGPEVYHSDDIQYRLGLSREQLVLLAYLLGCDYTSGLEGVGIVSSMELLRDFPGEKLEPLQKLRDWHQEALLKPALVKQANGVLKKLSKSPLPPNFPDEAVYQAYLSPEIDSSAEQFEWGRPDLDLLRQFARERMGWEQAKVDSLLLPILKKMHSQQKPITHFISLSQEPQRRAIRSRRIRNAVARLTDKESTSGDKRRPSSPLSQPVSKVPRLSHKTTRLPGKRAGGISASSSSSDSDS